MTLCNICGERLPNRDQAAFLCRTCVDYAPLAALLRYRRACNAMRQFRHATGLRATDAPMALRCELAASWRLCADAARAAYYAQQGHGL